MSKRFIFFFLILTSLFSSIAIAEQRYLLNSGDILDISVWNEEALQKQAVVLPDGIITFPLAGEIVAKDKTVADVEEELTKKLRNKYMLRCSDSRYDEPRVKRKNT